MPTYDYRCEANGRVLEVSHRMSERLQTWGELCAMLGMETGDTAPESPVTRLATGGNVVRAGSLKGVPPCEMGAACCGAKQCGY